MLRRRELPVRSPFRLSSLPGAAREAFFAAADPRDALRDLLVGHYDADGALLTASATHALTLALQASLRARPGAAVLLPAYTCFEVATAAVAADAQVVLYDLDERTLGPDWSSVAAAASGVAVAALVVSPVFGLPLAWARARDAARSAGALLVADVAQAHGSTSDGRAAGTEGDFIVLSFGRGKGWTGFGGGALLWKGAAASGGGGSAPVSTRGTAAEAKTFVSAAAQWTFGRPSLFDVPSSIPSLHIGETIYHEPTPVQTMTRASAALVLRSAVDATAEAAQRRRNAREYADLLDAADRRPPWADQIVRPEAGALRFPVAVPGGWTALRETAAPWLGAAPGYPTPLGRVAALAPLLRPADPAPIAERLAATLVTLPTHSGTTAAARSRLVDIVAARDL